MNPEKRRRRAKVKAREARIYRNGGYSQARRFFRGEYEVLKKGREALK